MCLMLLSSAFRIGVSDDGSAVLSLACRITHGPHDSCFENIAGKTVASVRRSLATVFSIPGYAQAFIGGSVVGGEYRLRAGEWLEFRRQGWGRKAGLPLNEYGNIVITDAIPEGLVHVDLPRLGPTCKRLGIEYAKAVVGWTDYGPILSGVVIHEADRPKLDQALAAKAQKQKRQVDQLPVLAALFTLNRRAKRCRDLAQTYYQNRMHGFAGKMKREKEGIYYLKGQVLHYLLEAGILIGGKFHKFPGGNWAEILQGDGYTFHRPSPPQQGDSVVEEIESVEAKPKRAKEPSLEVAFEVVEKFLERRERASIYQWPPAIRPQRRQEWDGDDEGRDDDEGWDNDEDDIF